MLFSGDFPTVITNATRHAKPVTFCKLANMTEFISSYIPLKLQSHCTGLSALIITE